MPTRKPPIEPQDEDGRNEDIALMMDDAGGGGDLPLSELDGLEEEDDIEVEIDREVEANDIETAGGAVEEDEIDDDDNPYGDSDEALPDDPGERALARDPAKSEGRFGD